MVRSLLQFYLKSLHEHPIKTKLVTSTTIAAASDILAQSMEKRGTQQQSHHQDEGYDWRRTLNMASWGMLIVPAMHGWYNVLERTFPMARQVMANSGQRITQKMNPAAVTLKRMVMDQSLYAPLSLAAFLMYMSTIENKNWQETKQKLKDDFAPTLLMNYKVWPLVQCINFWLIPVEHRVFFITFIGFFWNAYLSHVQHSQHEHPATNNNDSMDQYQQSQIPDRRQKSHA